jgi:N6-L-threonylcarbamoyladenine synthase
MKKDPDFIKHHLEDICASIQNTIVEILTRKIHAAAKQYHISEIGIAGGVAANSGLRKKLKELASANKWNVYFPAMQYCTDNAGMIAIAAYYQFLDHEFSSLDTGPFVRSTET